jgi:hypothetical protein
VRCKLPILLLFLGLGLTLHAQIDSSLLDKYITFSTTEYKLTRNLPYEVLDTNINKNDIYHPLYKNTIAFQDLGNIGSASRNAFFDWNKDMGFNFTFNPYEPYFKKHRDTKYFLAKKPFADIIYTQGQREFLQFGINAAINITPRLNVGGHYDRITSEGFYVNQKTSGYYTNLFASYFSKNKRYGLLAGFIRNRGINNENGGILSDSLFETLTGTNKSSDVRLEGAQARFKNTNLHLKQHYYLGKKIWTPNEEDSSFQILPAGFLAHTFNYHQEAFFFDNLAGDTSYLFPGLMPDSNAVFYDSILARTLTNSLSYVLWSKSNEKHQSLLSFSTHHQFIQTQMQGFGENLQNVWGEFRLERLPKSDNNIGLILMGAYNPIGYNQNDVKLSGDVLYRNKRFALTAGLTNQLREVDYTISRFNSTNFNWTNSYSKITVLNWRAGLSTRGFRNNFHLKFNQYVVANWVYFDQDVTPKQSSDVLLVNTLEASKTFQLGVLYLEHNLFLQNSNRDYVRLPEFGGNIRYFIHAAIFKKSLEFELGTTINYQTSWQGYAWNPAARAFHLQDNYTIGNYPLMDAFFNVKVLTMVVYLKMEHYNMDWMNTRFYLTPNHPLPIRAFRFGFRVRLYN